MLSSVDNTHETYSYGGHKSSNQLTWLNRDTAHLNSNEFGSLLTQQYAIHEGLHFESRLLDPHIITFPLIFAWSLF